MPKISKGWHEEWPAVEVELATKWKRRGFSSSQIAKALNLIFGKRRSRNSVIGKLHRIKHNQGETR